MEKIAILLVDDHRLILDSWAFILNSDPRFEVVGETNNGEQAIQLALLKQPDVILMDVNMSPLNGFDTTKEIRRLVPKARVIGVSMHSMPAYAKRMLQLGAMGYVTKNSSKDEMITAITEVYQGKKYICEEVKNILAQQELDEHTSAVPDMNNLSKRELDIIGLIREGHSSKEIGRRLEISLKTVEVHRYNILKKLNLKNTAALVNFINTHGL